MFSYIAAMFNASPRMPQRACSYICKCHRVDVMCQSAIFPIPRHSRFYRTRVARGLRNVRCWPLSNCLLRKLGTFALLLLFLVVHYYVTSSMSVPKMYWIGIISRFRLWQLATRYRTNLQLCHFVTERCSVDISVI